MTVHARRTDGGFLVVAVLIAILGAGLRITTSVDAVAAAEVDAWRSAKSDGGLLTLAEQPLPALLIRATGDPGHWWFYRIPSLLAGVGTIFLAGFALLKRGRADAVVAMLLTSVSFFLVLRGSEAGGGTLAALCAVACFLFLRRHFERPRWRSSIGFAACLLAGYAARPSFLVIHLAAIVATLWHFRREGLWKKDGAVAFARLHAIPLAILAIGYLVRLQRVPWPTGGTPSSALAIESIALALGVAPEGGAGVAVGALVLALFVAAIVTLWHDRPAWASFLLVAAVLGPELVLWAGGPRAFQQADMAMFIQLLLLALALLLGLAWRRGGVWGRAACLSACILVAAGNGGLFAAHLDHGRGDPLAAFRLMADQSPRAEVVFATTDDAEVASIAAYYGRYVGKPLRCEPRVQAADWFIRVTNVAPAAPPQTWSYVGERFTLAQVFPASRWAGRTWMVYRRTSP